MPLFNKACCCLSLKTGTLIIGWLGIIQSVLNILLLFLELIQQNSSAVPFKIVINVINFGISYLLLEGANKDDQRYIIPWLSFNGVGLVLIIILIIAYPIVIGPSTDFPDPIIIVSILCIVEVWWLYVWLCIYSYYQELNVIDVVV